MSRPKAVPIDKKRVMNRLASLSMHQKDLAYSPPQGSSEKSGILEGYGNNQSFSRALNRGLVSESARDELAQVLDLAPEYLSGLPLYDMGSDEDNERFYSYDFHVSQTQPSRKMQVTDLLWRMAGIKPGTIPPETYWGLWFCVEKAADEYIEKHRK